MPSHPSQPHRRRRDPRRHGPRSRHGDARHRRDDRGAPVRADQRLPSTGCSSSRAARAPARRRSRCIARRGCSTTTARSSSAQASSSSARTARSWSTSRRCCRRSASRRSCSPRSIACPSSATCASETTERTRRRAAQGRHPHGGDRSARGRWPRSAARRATWRSVDRARTRIVAAGGPRSPHCVDGRVAEWQDLPRCARGLPTRARGAGATSRAGERRGLSARARARRRSRWRSPGRAGPLDRIWPTVTAPAGRPRPARPAAAARRGGGLVADRRTSGRCCSASAGARCATSRGPPQTCRCSTRPTRRCAV